MLLRCLGTERVVLVTDAMAAAGLGDSKYELLGHEVFVKNGAARQANGTIAGSAATLIQCVRNIVQVVGTPLCEAIRMASHNPARALGLDHQHGLLEAGRDASLVVLDPDLAVAMTFVQGRCVHTKDRMVAK